MKMKFGLALAISLAVSTVSSIADTTCPTGARACQAGHVMICVCGGGSCTWADSDQTCYSPDVGERYLALLRRPAT